MWHSLWSRSEIDLRISLIPGLATRSKILEGLKHQGSDFEAFRFMISWGIEKRIVLLGTAGRIALASFFATIVDERP